MIHGNPTDKANAIHGVVLVKWRGQSFESLQFQEIGRKLPPLNLDVTGVGLTRGLIPPDP